MKEDSAARDFVFAKLMYQSNTSVQIKQFHAAREIEELF